MSAQPLPVDSTRPSSTSECSPYTIPVGSWKWSCSSATKLIGVAGLFIVNDTFVLNLTDNAIFEPACIGGTSGIVHGGTGDNSTVTDPRAPFYSSTAPQMFAIATATVISYFLVILIFITPRTFFVGGPGGGAGFLTRSGLSGNSSVIGVGRRPLLQKIAAITVAVSMTIATADTFTVAKEQYEDGFMNSEKLVTQVIGGVEIRIVQVISDTFLWLAQVQTLIRLFPRHKEKVTIKWLGFALILFDVIFSSLNNFLVTGAVPRPLKSRDAIPALSYLFELAIGFIYASAQSPPISFLIASIAVAMWSPSVPINAIHGGDVQHLITIIDLSAKDSIFPLIPLQGLDSFHPFPDHNACCCRTDPADVEAPSRDIRE